MTLLERVQHQPYGDFFMGKKKTPNIDKAVCNMCGFFLIRNNKKQSADRFLQEFEAHLKTHFRQGIVIIREEVKEKIIN